MKRKEMVNMKRLIALLLAAVLALSLVACGGETSMTQEEMLEVAEEKEFTDFTAGNKAYAESCVGDIYKMTGYVLSVGSDYVTLSRQTDSYFGENGANYISPIYLYVYLPTDELANLTVNQEVSFVGEVTDVTEEENEFVPNKVVCLVIENAYLIENTAETHSD